MAEEDAKAMLHTPGLTAALSLIGASLAVMGMWFALERAQAAAWGEMLLGVVLVTTSLMWLQWVRNDMEAAA